MRTLKFRAWNGEQMVSPDYISRDGTAWWKENSIPTYSKIVMQFTGLLDDNDKEIFENDIVQWTESADIEAGAIIGIHNIITGIYIVKWDENLCTLVFYDPYENIVYHFDEADFDIVIGNIYENPNLLP